MSLYRHEIILTDGSLQPKVIAENSFKSLFCRCAYSWYQDKAKAMGFVKRRASECLTGFYFVKDETGDTLELK